MCKFDHSLLILRKNFDRDRSMYAICVGLGKFCSQFALFTKKNYAVNKIFTRPPVPPVATNIISASYAVFRVGALCQCLSLIGVKMFGKKEIQICFLLNVEYQELFFIRIWLISPPHCSESFL